MVVKFLEQFAMVLDALGNSGAYDTTDGFFYDLLSDGSGNKEPIRVQTLVGVIPALPAVSLPVEHSERMQRLRKRFARRLEQRDGATLHRGGSARTETRLKCSSRSCPRTS